MSNILRNTRKNVRNIEHCALCQGTGQIYKAFCPVCNPVEAEIQALSRLDQPTWDPYWVQMQARYYGERFIKPPILLVIHSGATASNVAEYFTDPGDGRKASAHLAWSREHKRLVQCVPLSHAAWHAGGSTWRGKGRVNWYSIGIELPGPWKKKRPAKEIANLRSSVSHIVKLIPSLKHVVRHSDIDPHKKDPGPGFSWECLEGLGLEAG